MIRFHRSLLMHVFLRRRAQAKGNLYVLEKAVLEH
jgi:hypothetical protein